MPTMTHKNKVKFARRLCTQKEIRENVSIFDSHAWRGRVEARKEKNKRTKQENVNSYVEDNKLSWWRRLIRFFKNLIK